MRYYYLLFMLFLVLLYVCFFLCFPSLFLLFPCVCVCLLALSLLFVCSVLLSVVYFVRLLNFTAVASEHHSVVFIIFFKFPTLCIFIKPLSHVCHLTSHCTSRLSPHLRIHSLCLTTYAK
jgi:hypothetical protein